MTESTHYRACHLCEAICGLEIKTNGSEIVSIKGDKEDPFSRGHICPKAVAIKDIQSSLAKYELRNGSKEIVTTLPNDDYRSDVEKIPDVVQVMPQNAPKRWFELDAVFDKTSTQDDVYVQSGAKHAVCENIFKGFHCTILAYGQTGTFLLVSVDPYEDEQLDNALLDIEYPNKGDEYEVKRLGIQKKYDRISPYK